MARIFAYVNWWLKSADSPLAVDDPWTTYRAKLGLKVAGIAPTYCGKPKTLEPVFEVVKVPSAVASTSTRVLACSLCVSCGLCFLWSSYVTCAAFCSLCVTCAGHCFLWSTCYSVGFLWSPCGPLAMQKAPHGSNTHTNTRPRRHKVWHSGQDRHPALIGRVHHAFVASPSAQPARHTVAASTRDWPRQACPPLLLSASWFRRCLVPSLQDCWLSRLLSCRLTHSWLRWLVRLGSSARCVYHLQSAAQRRVFGGRLSASEGIGSAQEAIRPIEPHSPLRCVT